MGAGADEGDGPTLAHAVVDVIDQQEIADHVAFTVALPVAFQRMIAPIGSQ